MHFPWNGNVPHLSTDPRLVITTLHDVLPLFSRDISAISTGKDGTGKNGKETSPNRLVAYRFGVLEAGDLKNFQCAANRSSSLLGQRFIPARFFQACWSIRVFSVCGRLRSPERSPGTARGVPPTPQGRQTAIKTGPHRNRLHVSDTFRRLVPRVSAWARSRSEVTSPMSAGFSYTPTHWLLFILPNMKGSAFHHWRP